MTAPAVLSDVSGVELVRTGQWSASTGVATITRADLAEAVAAMACPAVRDPIIKLGHCDPRFDGEPAVGRVTNMSVVNECSLIGDLTGMPGWLGPVLASAYPSRSIEGEWAFKCSVGHVHPFVITGLALLGVTEPAIGSLGDVAELWSPTTEAAMAKKIAASATVEDIRRAYYDSAAWELWIEEIQLDPVQLIVVDDESGVRLRIPVSIDPAADGSDAVTFGDPVPVVVRYDDVPEPAESVGNPAAPPMVAASSLRFASRAESRRDIHASDQSKEEANMADTPTPASNPGGLTDEQMTAIRTACGLTPDADPDVVVAALLALTQKVQAVDESDDADGTDDEPLGEGAADTSAPAAPAPQPVAASAAHKPNTVTVDAEKWDEVQTFMAAARKRDQADAEKRADDMVDAAFKAGKIGRSTVVQYKTLARSNYGETKKLLDGIAASTAFPVDELGHGVDFDTDADATASNVRENAVYKAWEV